MFFYRSARLAEVAPLIDQAKKESLKETGSIEPGLHYCIGLQQRFGSILFLLHCILLVISSYLFNHPDAIRSFNLCRNDVEWNTKALVQMIRIYLSFEIEKSASALTSRERYRLDASEEDALVSAKTLITEAFNNIIPSSADSSPDDLSTLSPTDASLYKHIKTLDFYALSAAAAANYNGSQGRPSPHTPPTAYQWSNARSDLQKYIKAFDVQKRSLDPSERLPAIVAIAHNQLRQADDSQALESLREATRCPPTPDLFEQFELAYTTLAELYLQVCYLSSFSHLFFVLKTPQKRNQSQTETACKNCLRINNSSAKAHDILGQLYERGNNFEDSTKHLEDAWHLHQESDPSIGFRLAHNYMKASRYIDAIEVSQLILRKFPTFPRIKEDILDKCRGFIRMPRNGD